MSRKKSLILYQLSIAMIENDQFISALSLAKLLGISEKNLRNKVEELDEALRDTKLGRIEKIPRKGMRLLYEAKDKAAIKQLFESYDYIDLVAGEETLYSYLRILLSNSTQRLTVEGLSRMVYDSVPVCSKHLETCANWLSLFNIELSVKRNCGIVLQGKEENIRLAIKHLVVNDLTNTVEHSIQLFAKGINLALLKQCIHDIEHEWNFKFAEESYHSILLYAALAITRCDVQAISLRDIEEEIVVKYNEYNLAQSLFRKINERFYVSIPENEITYFAIQLLCSKMIRTQYVPESDEVQTYDKKLKEFVHKIISVVSDIINIDLTQDQELYYGLLNHIRPAIFRMKFEKHSTNDLTSFIQEEYKYTYRVSWALSTLFEEYYDIQISSTELSYITLYIQTSLDRRVKPLKIALITELGMGLNQMFCNKIKLSIPKIDDIAIYSLHDFKQEIINDFDLVVTTSKLSYENEKIIQIKSLLSSNGVEELKKKIEWIRSEKLSKKSKFDVVCHNLFDPKLILIQPDIQNKEELLKLMCKTLSDNGYVTDGYYKSVMDRERAVSTYIGNLVAIPHGFQSYVNESKIMIAILDHAIRWNEQDEVKAVFMLALRINTTFESKRTQLFYKSFLNLIDTDQDVDYILQMKQHELYKFLIR